MGIPSYEDSKRGDLEATGLLYDQAMGSSAEKMQKDQSRGTENLGGLVKPDENFEQGLGGGGHVSEAIQQRSMQNYGHEQKALSFMQKQHAVDRHFQKLQTASDMVRQEMQMNYEKAMQKYAADQARKRARGGVISSVLGVVGAVAGAVVGVYTTGGTGSAGMAAAGYAGGSALGGAIQGE